MSDPRAVPEGAVNVDLRPVNSPRLRFRGVVIGSAYSASTVVRIYQTATGYVGEVILNWLDGERLVRVQQAYVGRTGDKLARALMRSRGGMDWDDEDLPLLRQALDEANIENGKEV